MSAINWVYKIQNTKNKRLQKIYIRLLRTVYSCDYTPACHIGKGVLLNHNGLGSVIWAKSIGDNTQLWQNVTLGSGKGEYPDIYPTIGKNCKIFTGAVVIGNITVGNGAIVGANSVVTHDVPPNAVVAGAPARILRYIDSETLSTHTHK